MDPDVTFDEMLIISHRLLTDEHLEPGDIHQDAMALAEHFKNFAEWLTSGGFLPSQLVRK